MPLTKNDIKLLKEGLKDTFVTKEDLIQALSDQTRITVDIMRQETHAIIKRELHLAKKEIIDEISDFIGNSLIPQLDNHETRLTKLESVRV